jgi:hypothetical protein
MVYLYNQILFIIKKEITGSWVWWYMPVIPALWRLRQEYLEFEASLGCTGRPCLKPNKQTKKTPKVWVCITR